MAALLTAAAVGAGAERRRSEQALLRVRGVSTVGLVRLAAAEAVLVAGLGSLIGIGGAVVVDRIFLGSSSGTGTSGAPLLWSLAGLAFALVVAAATVLPPTVRDLRKSTVADTAHAVRQGTARLPWWLRYGVDVALLAGAGIVFWASSSNNYSLVLAPEGVATVSVSYWAFLGPVLLWLGAAALLTRIVLVVLAHARRPLAAALRPLTGRLATPGAASLSRQRPALARAVVLLALALSFAGSTATFNATYQQQAEADAQLTNGADVAVTEAPAAHVTPQAGQVLAAVPGVRRVEPVQHRFAYVGADLQDLYGVRPATIGSVTALQDGYFSGGTAKQLIGSLAARPDGILVSAETVKDFQLSPGDLINLRLQDGTTKALKTVPFHFAGIVTEFPTAPKDSFFVANADYIAKATGNNSVGAFLLDTGGTDQKAVAARVQAKLGDSAAVTDITSTRGRVGSSLTSVDLGGLTRLELTFAILLSVAAGGLVLGIGLAERRRSLAILSVLGARRKQLRGLVVGEGLMITVGGLLGGIAIGATLSLMLVKVLTGVFDPPPSSMAIPWTYLVTTGVAVTAALGIAALVGARASTRPAVEELREL
ncbi:MAG: ABC transporter permease [Nocardioides sp.]